MVAASLTEDQVRAALRAVDEAEATTGEKAEMLMEIAMGLQQQPKSVEDLNAAVTLYQKSLKLCGQGPQLLIARISARMATALMATPSDSAHLLEQAREVLEASLLTFASQGTAEETAEAEMNLGLVLQNLAGMQRARIQDSISAYQRALRTFDKQKHPKEFAILQNNLATAFLSIPFADQKGKLREALAVQAFEEGLSVVSLLDHPVEYAMLQNNLGNALQYVSSSHHIQNGFRALAAYDEALRVRTRRDMPEAYANTLSNKANCLANLPDHPDDVDAGNPQGLLAALELYREALSLFEQLGQADKAREVSYAIRELEGTRAAIDDEVNRSSRVTMQ